MTSVARDRRARLTLPSWAPVAVLVVISLLSLGARAYRLDEPCASPCTSAADHTLIFDEAYYVNAARVIAHIRPAQGSHYDDSPLGSDPNAEHPQGAKLVMAAAIELLGDGPFAWRIGSLLFMSAAILGMYALVRFAGGGPWSAVGAATLMAADNMMLVTGRIGILDGYALAPMVWGVALYLRGRVWPAAVLLALADCFKEVAPYALLVLGLLELGRVLLRRRDPSLPPSWGLWPSVFRLAVAVAASVALFILGLWVMGLIATPYADSQRWLITGGPFVHLWHMVSYASALTSPHGATGIASYPWQWLLGEGVITYLRVTPSLPGAGAGSIHPVCWFRGAINPPMLALALPAFAFCLARVARGPRPRRDGRPGRSGADVPTARAGADAPTARSGADAPTGRLEGDVPPAWPGADVPTARAGADAPTARTGAAAGGLQLPLLAVAWCVGTWLPYELQSALDSRTSYLYYMIVVMPGIYLALCCLASSAWRLRRAWTRALVGAWGISVLVFAVAMYPFIGAF